MARTDAPLRSADGSARDSWQVCGREQEGLWLLEQTRDVGAVNHLTIAIRLRGRLDVTAVRAALGALIARHPALRSEFSFHNGRLHVRFRPLEDIDPLPPIETMESTEAEIAGHLRELTLRPVSLETWPPFHFTLIRMADRDALLFGVLHHGIFDGVSRDVLLDEFASAYGGHGEPAIPAEPLSQREQGEIDRLSDHAAAYWEPRLQDLDNVARLWSPPSVTDDPTAEEQIELRFDERLTTSISQLAVSQRSTPFVVVLAALRVLQYRERDDRDLSTVATAVAMDMRRSSDRHSIGMFANEAPLLSDVNESASFAQHVAACRDALSEFFALRRFPFSEALARWGSGSTRDASALADVGISAVRREAVARRVGDLEMELVPFPPAYGSRRPLMVYIAQHGTWVEARLRFDGRTIGASRAADIGQQLKTCLIQGCARPGNPVESIDLLSVEDHRMLRRWSVGPRPTVENVDLYSRVAAQAEHSPNAVALRMGGREVTYGELQRSATLLAARLLRRGAAADVPVGVCLPRSPEAIIALVAVLQSGATYLPLDPMYPAERLRHMLHATEAPLVVTDEQHMGLVAGAGAEPLLISAHVDQTAEKLSVARTQPTDLVYVLFTSGSTGRPKGVAMTHASISNLLAWQCRSFALPGPRRVLQYASTGFDVSYAEILSTLMTGGSLSLIDEDERRDLDLLARRILAERIERVFMPPFVLAQLARRWQALPAADGPLEAISAGEQLEVTQAMREVWGRRDDWTLENQYGPTETHVVTARRLAGAPDGWAERPDIGLPIDGARAYVLDEQGRPVAPGRPGQLHLGGAPVARGYVAGTPADNERFSSDRFRTTGRMYATGDRVCWQPDGSLAYLGRIDRQFKIRGYRVEPGEIESRLRAVPPVADVIVDVRPAESGGRQLIAYVVAPAAGKDLADKLRAALREALPPYMVPAAFVFLDCLPLTGNGKVDRAALPDPMLVAAEGSAARPPQTPIERALLGIWADVLGTTHFSVMDDLFEVGGDSLIAAEITSRIREQLGHDVTLREMLHEPTIAGIAAALDQRGVTA